MLHKNKFKVFLFVLTVGLISLTGIISWSPVMGQSSKELRVSPTPKQKESRIIQTTENIPVNWSIIDEKKPQQFEELLNQLPEKESFTAKRVIVRNGGGSEPQSILVIYRRDGTKLLCLGKGCPT